VTVPNGIIPLELLELNVPGVSCDTAAEAPISTAGNSIDSCKERLLFVIVIIRSGQWTTSDRVSM